jgi:hypothetical protein
MMMMMMIKMRKTPEETVTLSQSLVKINIISFIEFSTAFYAIYSHLHTDGQTDRQTDKQTNK